MDFFTRYDRKRVNHAAVSNGNKFFVIGGIYTTSCVVLDSCSREFIKVNLVMKISNL